MVSGDMKVEIPIADLSNRALLDETLRLACAAQQTTAKLIAALAEVDARKLWADEGCSSLYTYCTQVLRFSEHEAYLRMEAARVAQRFPVALEMLATGELSLTNIGLLKPHLTIENHVELLDAACGKSRREVARQVATLRDSGDRELRPAAIRLSSADRFEILVEIRDVTYEKLQRAKDLLSHSVPDGNIGEIIDRALAALIRELERTKYAATDRPQRVRATQPGSRYIVAGVRRTVWRRDSGRCAFVGPHGRCTATAFLEFHHIVPFAAGGASTVENIELRCRAHNQREAELFFRSQLPLLVRERSEWYGELGPDPVQRAGEQTFPLLVRTFGRSRSSATLPEAPQQQTETGRDVEWVRQTRGSKVRGWTSEMRRPS